MAMRIINIEQGSPEWVDLRGKYDCASEAPVIMGASNKLSRRELVRMKATGARKEFSEWVQKNLLDRGHEIEALARPMMEQELGPLYPVTCVDDELGKLASLDGLDLGQVTVWENKMWNEELAAMVRAGDLGAMWYWQLEHQLLVTGAERAVFSVTDGTPDRLEWMEYYPVPGRREELIAAWIQFNEDVRNYVHVEEAVQPVAKPIEALPALFVQIEGRVVSSNLKAFELAATDFISRIISELKTDQDFADAAKAVTFCDDAEKRLRMVKQQALANTASIEELFATIDRIEERLRIKRLALNTLVEKRKRDLRGEILQEGVDALKAHIASLNARIGKPFMPSVPADFAGAMKGKRSWSSMRDAVDGALASAKLQANAIADRIQINLQYLEANAGELRTLFADEGTLTQKAADDFRAVVDNRIHAHRQAEQARRDREERAERDRQAAATLAAAAPAPAALPRHDTVDGLPPGAPRIYPDEPRAALTGPAPRVTAGGEVRQFVRPTTAPARRPTDDEIVFVIAQHFNTSEATVIEWLLNIDLEAAGQRAASIPF